MERNSYTLVFLLQSCQSKGFGLRNDCSLSLSMPPTGLQAMPPPQGLPRFPSKHIYFQLQKKFTLLQTESCFWPEAFSTRGRAINHSSSPSAQNLGFSITRPWHPRTSAWHTQQFQICWQSPNNKAVHEADKNRLYCCASIVCPRLHSWPWIGQRYHLGRVGALCVKIAVLTVGRQMAVIIAVSQIFLLKD